MFDLIGKRNIFFAFSGALVFLSLLAIAVWRFTPGIDLVGGTLWQIKFTGNEIKERELSQFLNEKLGLKTTSVIRGMNSGDVIIKSRVINEKDHQEYIKGLEERFGVLEELRFESIGSAIGRELRNRAIWAIVLVLFGISLYVAFAFRKASQPVSSWQYGLVTVATLFHDVAIPAGLAALLGRFFSFEADTNFIVALLVIMGFSVHDTIVVFDRIRENLGKRYKSGDKQNSSGIFAAVVNDSVNETMRRSINTSLTLILVLLALYFIGPENLKDFILIILVGTIAGTYSSICIASPLLVWWEGRKRMG